MYPQYAREVVRTIFDALARMDNSELYVLKNVEDVCAAGSIDCEGMNSKEFKPLIEAALAHRQSFETVTIAWRGLYISAGSMFVALLSLFVATLTYLRADPRTY